MNYDDMGMLLEARAFAYHAMHAIFGMEPSEDSLKVYQEGVFSDLGAILDDEGFEDAASAMIDLEKAARSAADVDMLVSAYTLMLIGPGELPASPWESTYQSNERVLFQESTLDVRKAYVSQGLIPAGYPHVADDHISIECDFLAKMGDRISEAYGMKDGLKLAEHAKTSKIFLDKHLLTWVGRFRDGLCACDVPSRNPAGTFYVRAAIALAQFAAADSVLLERLPRMTA